MNANEILSKEYLKNISFEQTTQDKASMSVKTLHLRLKDKHASYLNELAIQVNQVCNFCNKHSLKVYRREHKFCSAYDMHPSIFSWRR